MLAMQWSPALADEGEHSLSVRVVASGLDNPRGIAVGWDNHVFVALAGRAGPGGYGTTGKIIEIAHGKVWTFRGNLPSAVSPEGDITGPTNVAVKGDDIEAVVGAGPQQLNPRFDSVLDIEHGVRQLADIQAYVNTHPDLTDLDQPPNPTDSNLYGMALIGDDRTVVTDAANNTLLLVGATGHVWTMAKFPNEVISTSQIPGFPVPAVPAEAVPTSVAVGSDGYYYVGELKGFPFTPGTSRIWKVAPWARNVTCDPNHPRAACSLFMDGFTSIVGLAFGKSGVLYVSEIVKNGVLGLFQGTDTVGALYKVWHGHKTELVRGRLTLPGDVAVGRDGTIYVTNNSVSIGHGQVLAIR
jgi:hypothetical protein